MLSTRNLLRNSREANGFALVVTLSLMALLMLVGVGLLTLSSVSLRTGSREEAIATARANARMALLLALGELQKAAGPDQRVTAAAGILPTRAADGRAHWIGVWDTSTYDPEKPDSKAFLRWLVSPDYPAELTEAYNAAGEDDVFILTGKDAASSVRVPKISLATGTAGSQACAYWVEDEGLKADLAWLEGDFGREERRQAARLSALPGVDYGTFGGPFDGRVNYPLQREGTDNPWLATLDKALSTADMPLVMNTDGNEAAWLREWRHDITLGSCGVMADVKKGGLRRDLSLAFEMDDTADVSATSQPVRFNRQAGEFVGGNDRLAGQHDAPGMPVRERFLYRVTRNDGSPFSGDLQRPDSVVRGPNWWALRDYYNLYKRLRGSGDGYTLQPRAYFPNNSAGSGNNYHALCQPMTPFTTTLWDNERTAVNQYVFHPARANYAPVLMGAVGLYSAKVQDGLLALVIDPLIYLWNPYNVTLKVDRYGVSMANGHGGKITFKVTKKDQAGQVISQNTYGPAKTDAFIKRKMELSGQATSGHSLTYLVKNLTMAPGEVVIVSPGSRTDPTATDLHDQAMPGVNLTDSSGVEINQMPLTQFNPTTERWDLVRWESVPLAQGDEVRCLYDVIFSYKGGTGNLANSAEHFFLAAFLPNDPAVKAGDLVTADTNADRIQTIGGNFAPRNWAGVKEYMVPEVTNISAYPESKWPLFKVAPGKYFFGVNSHLLKPAQYTSPDGAPMPNQNPAEVFSQFNPFRTGSFVEGHRVCRLNEVYCSLSKEGSVNSYIQNVGIQFPPADPQRGYWGRSYDGRGSTSIPFIDLPAAPLFSLADFANANLGLRASVPYKQVGNSHTSVFVPSNTLYAQPGESARVVTASDACWLVNDALFDRYYLSGIAPAFTIEAGGYSASGSVSETLRDFFGEDHRRAQANPVLHPCLPAGMTAADAVNALTAEDGYRKMGAYSLIHGAFNVNSTSVAAWTALLRGNRGLAVRRVDGPSEGTPFPNGTSPVTTAGSGAGWSGMSRLNDAEIQALAKEIVEQVKRRGPFMSLSDFVNRQVSGDENLNAAGALQAALDLTGAMSGLKSSAGGKTPVDPANILYNGSPVFPGDADLSARLSTEGIAGDIRQADLLRPLAPRLSARSDTFRIRAYGETLDANGKVLAKAICEAVVQRLPEYLDPVTDATNNEPWDETADTPGLNVTNRRFGRRFEVKTFRWLTANEI